MQPNKMKLKRKETIQVIIAAFAAAVAAFSAFGGKTVLRPVPRPALLERMVNGPDIIGIVHWGLNTYTDREWGYGDVDPKLLNPVSFDADQIVGAAKAGGIDRKKNRYNYQQ
jgi:alpha-L-fucosidase